VELSITAGFDGVGLHAATGYLPNQSQVTGSNRRTDAYRGSLERRTQFTLEVIGAMCSVRGADRVGIKLSPGFKINDTFDVNPNGPCGVSLFPGLVAFVSML
jgi:N-ethylmaleimide reductase